jgi:diacylglycerol kinase (ATP)
VEWLRLFISSLAHARAGIAHALRTERNVRIHLAATLAACALGLALQITAGEWCILLLASGMVWAAELLNTAVERLGNAVTRERNEDIRRAKDTAASAVLAAALAAAAVGLIVFVPKLWELWR